MSKRSYTAIQVRLKSIGCKVLPSYHALIEAKKKCYPDLIEIMEVSAEINLQRIINHTVQRICEVQQEVLLQMKSELRNVCFLFKWGCDGGSGYSSYKQSFSQAIDKGEDTAIFVISMVPIQLYSVTKTKKHILWQNPTRSSTRYCRSIKILLKSIKILLKSETDQLIKTETIKVKLQVEHLQSVSAALRPGHTYHTPFRCDSGPMLLQESDRCGIGKRIEQFKRWFLATGDSFKTISFSYRLGRSTVCSIVHHTSRAVVEVLLKEVMPVPDVVKWNEIATEFWERWQFPNCIGAMDGKHVTIQAPKLSGSPALRVPLCSMAISYELKWQMLHYTFSRDARRYAAVAQDSGRREASRRHDFRRMVGVCVVKHCYGTKTSMHGFPNPKKDMEMFKKYGFWTEQSFVTYSISKATTFARFINPTATAFIPSYKSLLVNNFTVRHSIGSNCEDDRCNMLVTLEKIINQKISAQHEKPLAYVNIRTPNISREHSDLDSRSLVRYCSKNVPFHFIECQHSELIEHNVIKKFVRIIIYNYIKQVNRILIGKDKRKMDEATDDIFKQAIVMQNKNKTKK
ncbi:hypothetical protein QE152_g6951 [Popillia japonica]|uniref:Protein ANTAGONIST OF LIKE HETEROCHROMATIN PROTEIN 1-like n=1 Tax=Popillia japonica TaxID=7064 RepID=A0AAW1MGG0_POPJA